MPFHKIILLLLLEQSKKKTIWRKVPFCILFLPSYHEKCPRLQYWLMVTRGNIILLLQYPSLCNINSYMVEMWQHLTACGNVHIKQTGHLGAIRRNYFMLQHIVLWCILVHVALIQYIAVQLIETQYISIISVFLPVIKWKPLWNILK